MLEGKKTGVHESHGALLMALQPLAETNCLLKTKYYLDRMFVASVQNAPETETDNYTAKDLGEVYLALSKSLLLLYKEKEKIFVNADYQLLNDDFF
ncbi:MAG: hypothetical protein J0M25_00605 [Flavobacteriales bacterium]|nr:hypothetical protein [Flavobacteriales bacterium]